METKLNILITGGSGLIGRALTKHLLEKGYSVSWLVRQPSASYPVKSFAWNPDKGKIDELAFSNIHALIHLAGAGIGDKSWTPAWKRQILESRVKGAILLASTLDKLNLKVE